MQQIQLPSFEAALLSRVVQSNRDDLPIAGARALLKLEFTDDDRERMHDLVVKNQSGKLSKSEESELDSYIRVGRLVDLLAAKARLSLKNHGRGA